ncbi:MAG: GNAT family N-acetyltransferase [Vicingaceae bacterium]
MKNDLQIKHYNRNALKELVEASDYLAQKYYPISPHRAHSLINNPRGQEEDILLITAHHNAQLVGYRTAMPDFVPVGNGKVSFAWICGTWIHPDFRRKGIATMLFQELKRAWQGRLFFTNYAPVSKKIYDQTGLFELYKYHKGIRYYMRFNLAELLPAKIPFIAHFNIFLRFIDSVGNTLIRPLMVRKIKAPEYTSVSLEDQIWNRVQGMFQKSLFRRGEGEFNWLRDYPWVIDFSKKETYDRSRFQFSWIEEPYRRDVLTFLHQGQRQQIFISQKGGRITIPYYDLDKGAFNQAARIIVFEATKRSANEIDCYQRDLVLELHQLKPFGLFLKDLDRNYMISKGLHSLFPSSDNIQLFDGEGDVVFT